MKAKKALSDPARFTPAEWLPGDPGYEPDEDPAETFFHVIAQPRDTDEKYALIVHLAYEQGRPLDLVPGRRYLVNAKDAAAAAAQVNEIEARIAAHDPEHIARFGLGPPWFAGLTVEADDYFHARRDPEPAQPQEAFVLDREAAQRRTGRQVQAGLG